MIDKILEFAMRQRALVLLGALVLFGLGIWSAVKLPIDAVPDITGVQVTINSEVAALAGEESERLVTRPIEIEMAGLPGVEEMRSLTKFGLSQVTLNFADGTDIFRARQLVSERLQGVLERLPKDVSPKLAPISTGLGEIYYYTVGYKPGAKKPDSLMEQLHELSMTQEYTIKPLLRTVKGIAEINESGGYERQYVVQPTPEALEKAGMTFSELAEVIAANVENAGGGIINRGGEQFTVRAVSRVNNLEEIENLPIKFGAAVRPLIVKDVAEVTYGVRFRTGAAMLNGEETVIGTTMMLFGENSREVSQSVKERVAEIQDKLPERMEITAQYDRSILINKTIATVRKNLFEGAILVVAVLLALLGNWRAALIVTAAIPLSFLFALTGMECFGISGNLMSLGAIDFGLIIDGAVVIVENIVRQLAARQHKLGRVLTDEEHTHVVLAASRQVGTPMFFGVLIITIVYFPILTLTGIAGKMFHPMAKLRADDAQINALPLRVGQTGLIHLGEVVDFKTTKVVEPILRDDGHRRAAIMVNLKGRDIESYVRDAEARIKQQVKMPDGYIVEFGGQFENLREARTRLFIVVPTTLALILVLVFISFGSVRQTLIICTGVPLAVTGGVFALWICQMPFSISAAIGFIALSGVAVLDGLVMLSYFNELREHGKSVRDAVIEGSLTRLRPVLMTALVASFGFVPMALATGAGAEVQRPLAIVVIGGLLTSTFLKLVLLPVLYDWFEKRNERDDGKGGDVTAPKTLPEPTPANMAE